MTIEGIPDGWELMRIGAPLIGEWVVGSDGRALKWNHIATNHGYAIIRKIEKPKQYMPFAKPEEAEPLLGEPLRLKADHKTKFLFIGITAHAFQIGHEVYSPKRAFDLYERLDNTPFGVEVTE